MVKIKTIHLHSKEESEVKFSLLKKKKEKQKLTRLFKLFEIIFIFDIFFLKKINIFDFLNLNKKCIFQKAFYLLVSIKDHHDQFAKQLLFLKWPQHIHML